MGAKPADRETSVDKTSGIEKFIGVSLRATEAELAAVGHIPRADSQFQEGLDVPQIAPTPEREIVEGID
jgi:hypothetical protein